ncbi:MAG: hypothetical protein ACLUSV_04070 [Streptococcus sp.]
MIQAYQKAGIGVMDVVYNHTILLTVHPSNCLYQLIITVCMTMVRFKMVLVVEMKQRVQEMFRKYMIDS